MKARTQGFTLLELLVAGFIMALIALLGWRALDGIAHGRDAAQDRLDAASRLSLALSQLGDDLDAARDAGGNLPAVSLAGNGDLLIVRRPPEPLGDDLRSPAASPPDPAAGRFQIVRWGLRSGALWRWHGPPLDSRAGLTAEVRAPSGQALNMLSGVNGMRVQVYRFADATMSTPKQSGAWVNPYTSDGATPGATPAQLAALRTPGAIRIFLQLSTPQLRGQIERAFLLETRQ